MEQNFTCVQCHEAANFECGCEANVYLCAGHVGVHMMKAGSHIPVPLSIKIDELRRKRDEKQRAVTLLQDKLHQLLSSIQQERNTLAACIANQCTESIAQVRVAYTRVQTEIGLKYDQLEGEMLTISEEIEQYESTNVPAFSEMTQLFISSACHLSSTSPGFLSLPSILRRCVDITVKTAPCPDSIDALMRNWGVRLACTCSDCQQVCIAMSVPQQPAPSLAYSDSPVTHLATVSSSQFQLIETSNFSRKLTRLSQEISVDSQSVFAVMDDLSVFVCGGAG